MLGELLRTEVDNQIYQERPKAMICSYSVKGLCKVDECEE